MSVRIPADVDREDRVIGPLTARQLFILSVAGIVLYGTYTITRAFVPLPVFLVVAIPIGMAAAFLALGQRDGITLDRLALAALRQRLSPQHRVAAPEGIRAVPEWLDHAVSTKGKNREASAASVVSPAALRLPAEAVTNTGVIDLGKDGVAVVAVCSTINFGLRTPAEQESLVASFGRYLHSLTAPVQVLIRAERLDLSGQIAELREQAGGLPHPALEQAALEHAEYLDQLGRATDLLRRQVLLILREPLLATRPTDGLGGASPLTALVARHRAAKQTGMVDDATRRAAETRLVRRLGEAVELLSPSGIVVTPLDAGQATAVLASACNPDSLLPPNSGLAGSDEVITTAPEAGWDDTAFGYSVSAPDTGDRWDDGFDDTAEDPDDYDNTARRYRLKTNTKHPNRKTAALGRASAFTPDAISIRPRALEVGGEWVASFAVVGYPREVHPGWLQPLLTYPGRVDVALHIDPIDPVTAANRLKKQLSKLESGRWRTSEKGRLLDPQVEAATEDAYDLSARVARGEGKLYRLGLYLTVHAPTEKALGNEVAAIRSLAASLLLDAKPTTYRSLQGWITSLPMGLDLVGMRRTFDTSALSAAFPFTSPDLPPPDPTSVGAPSGVLYGFNVGSQGLVHHDRFALDNHNSVILGRSGAGKSYLVKLELLRSLYRGIEIHVIDPEDEYTRLAHAVGGIHIHIGAEQVRLNPMDLPIHTRPDGRRTAPRDALIRRSVFLHTVISVLLGAELAATERAGLDRAITATYQRVGITSDPRTWTRPAPLLANLAEVLTDSGDAAGVELAARLHPYVTGAFSGLFSGPTSTRPEGHLVVFSLRDLADELKPIGTLLTLDTVWRQVSNPAIRKPRLVVVDEAWLLMKQPTGAEFLFRMAKASRKHWAGLTVATQDTADLLGSDLGKAVVANAATQILLRQAAQAIDEITHTFDLSLGERQFLLSADRGQGLLSTGTQRVAFQSIASPVEHHLVTTSPAELVEYADNPSGIENSFIELDANDPVEVTDSFDDSGMSQIELDAA